MNTTDRRPLRRAVTVCAVTLASAAVLAAAALGLSQSGLIGGRAHASLAAAVSPARAQTALSVPAAAAGTSRPGLLQAGAPGADHAPAAAAGPAAPHLTSQERRACPAAATACVDLSAHLTWLQSGGKVSFGPVPMEPGPGAQGTPHATPIGTWQVQWKAGPGYVSHTYFEPMPWATFFAPGGIAFHGGSLTRSSHGCVHLRLADARYYHNHLPVGAEVVVFRGS